MAGGHDAQQTQEATFGAHAVLGTIQDVLKEYEDGRDAEVFLRETARIHRDLEGGGGLVRDLTIGDPKMPGIAHRIWQASFSDVAGQNETPLVSLTIRRLSCVLLDRHLQTRNAPSDQQHLHHVGDLLDLYTRMSSVAEGFRRRNELAAATQLADETGAQVAKAITLFDKTETAEGTPDPAISLDSKFHRLYLQLQHLEILCGETRVTRTESDSTQGAGEDKAPSSSAQQSTRSGSTCPASIDPVPVWDTKKNPSSIDPNRFGALVLNPNAGEGTRLVVVDPALGKHLKEHQKEAVLWVYRMLFGGGEQPGRQGPEPGKRLGVILAHEMGLGKTLTAIALFTTVLEQSPEDTTYGEVQKIIVTAPLSNCHQWILEIAKWLGHYKVKVCWVKTKEDAEHFRKSAKDQVMVVSHSSFVKLAPEIHKMNDVGLVIVDEAHFFKNVNMTLAARAISELPAATRILSITGTPLQNNLCELWQTVWMVAPSYLGPLDIFKRDFVRPIEAILEPNCSADSMRSGVAAVKELRALIFSPCSPVLVRTCEEIEQDLPPKETVIVLLSMTPEQASMLTDEPAEENGEMQLDRDSVWLERQWMMKRILLHPDLGKPCQPNQVINVQHSNKLMFVCKLLEESVPHDIKVLIISTCSSSLLLMEFVCQKLHIGYIKIDGSVPAGDRIPLVAIFNDPSSTAKVCLLSSQAGGVGLNLTGASRVVMLDSSWNPATDMQAMARVSRYGQRNKVVIYRLLVRDSVDEKIFLAQERKKTLYAMVMQNPGPSESMIEELATESVGALGFNSGMIRGYGWLTCSELAILPCLQQDSKFLRELSAVGSASGTTAAVVSSLLIELQDRHPVDAHRSLTAEQDVGTKRKRVVGGAIIESEEEMDVDDAGADESRVNVDADAESDLDVIPDSQECDTDQAV